MAIPSEVLGVLKSIGESIANFSKPEQFNIKELKLLKKAVYFAQMYIDTNESEGLGPEKRALLLAKYKKLFNRFIV